MNARRSDAACSDCDRRGFLKAAAGVALAAQGASLLRAEEAKPVSTPENAVKALYDSLSDKQKKDVCFAWDHVDPNRGLLRTRISNNWNITKPTIIDDDYYTKEQRGLVREIFEGLIQPDWHARIDKQLDDDAGGFGHEQSFAIFGQPGTNQFEFVMTGRHMTLRCDGNSTDHVAFGGPIFYGHAASGFDENPGHPGNVFWEQAIAANDVFKILDGKQRERAALPKTPSESAVQFQGKEGKFPGLPVAEMTGDQKEAVQKTLQKLIEPYRQSDRDEVLACLKTQGGLDACSLAFYTDHDLGEDKVWDNWRLEGPSFVWYFRGYPHVHCWVNVASSPEPKLNA